MVRHRRNTLFSLIAVCAAALIQVPAAAQERMRISLDTNPSHVSNRGMEIFVAELKKRVGDKLVIEVYPSAQLFRDRDIPKALRQGSVEMGIPGTWLLDGVEPNTGMQTLPMFYGVDADIVHKVMDGKLGQFLNKRMEERLKVKIIGKWTDLGFTNVYSTSRPLTAHDHLKGMKIRFPGGSANGGRIKALGATPVMIAWPDLALAMSQGVVDGVVTTHESVYSAKLWDSGLKYSFEDKQFFGQSVPMMNLAFWNKQPKEIQNAILDAWEISLRGQREMAAKAQMDARETLIKHGIKMAAPSPAEIVAARKRLMAVQNDLVKEMKIDTDAVQLAVEELRAAKVEF